MTAENKRILIWSILALLIAAGVAYAVAPRPVLVDVIIARHAPMVVTVDEEAYTRVHDVFALSAPVAGHIKRIDIHVGDAVTAKETIVASIEPTDPQFLDPRSESQARAGVQAAESALTLAGAKVDEAIAEREYAEIEYNRARELIGKGTITKREFDAAKRAFRTTSAALATSQAAVQMRSFELEQAKALLLSPAQTHAANKSCACVDVASPISGQILKIFNPSERVVSAGDPLVEIGDPSDLEVVADYLSTDAVRIEAGQKVSIRNWGGEAPLEGNVRTVEPRGFTKVSALGIEEQRVNVIIDFTSPAAEWSKLGHGYQLETQVVLWDSEQVLAIPLTALFRIGDAWSVFISNNGRAEIRTVELGRRNGLVAQVLTGIELGDHVVVHPSDRVLDGIRITARG